MSPSDRLVITWTMNVLVILLNCFSGTFALQALLLHPCKKSKFVLSLYSYAQDVFWFLFIMKLNWQIKPDLYYWRQQLISFLTGYWSWSGNFPEQKVWWIDSKYWNGCQGRPWFGKVKIFWSLYSIPLHVCSNLKLAADCPHWFL